MKFMLTTPFVIGQFCIDAGVTIDLNVPREFWNDNAKLAYGRIMPADAICMDRESVALWRKVYGRIGSFHLKQSLEWFEDDRFWPAVREAMKEVLGPGPKAEVRVIYEHASANVAGWSYE
jgi:hypothetical protein